MVWLPGMPSAAGAVTVVPMDTEACGQLRPPLAPVAYAPASSPTSPGPTQCCRRFERAAARSGLSADHLHGLWATYRLGPQRTGEKLESCAVRATGES